MVGSEGAGLGTDGSFLFSSLLPLSLHQMTRISSPTTILPSSVYLSSANARKKEREVADLFYSFPRPCLMSFPNDVLTLEPALRCF